MLPSLTQLTTQTLNHLNAQHRLRAPIVTTRTPHAHLIRNGRTLISFSCNDYLGLSQHPDVKKAAMHATQTYGVGAGASQLITGYNPLLQALETTLQKYKNTEAAMVFGSGYLANIGTIPALVGKNDLILADKLSHACLLDGAQLSGAKRLRFKHNDLSHLKHLLAKHRTQYRNCLVLVDHVYSMDGDLAPMQDLRKLCDEYDVWLMCDDAHGLGIIHKGTEYADIQMGTFSKAVGGYGAYVCGNTALIDYLRNKARSYIYSTALPPASLAAAKTSLEIISATPALAEHALANARYFTTLMTLPAAQSTIVPVIIGENDKAVALSQQLENAGLLVSAIRPPTVPEGTARLRFTFSCEHQREDIENVAKIVSSQTT